MSNYSQLKDVLNDVFELNKADLDFGIYRIINQKRKQVNEFIDKQLPEDIKKALGETQSVDKTELERELKTLKKNLEDAGIVAEDSPKYKRLCEQLQGLDNTDGLEAEVFSHLANFFRRYYKDGDFISMRRYKKDVYAIPYEGEEVKLHWANHDQYYIKSSENFKNYSFLLPDGKKVSFRLKEVSTEQNNNKTQGDAERRFAIYEETPVEEQGDELFINFIYEPFPKATKQDALLTRAVEELIDKIPGTYRGILALSPTEKKKDRTLLEKHLEDYVAKNSFDYFIHKDLGGFLSRELDFYIKNEVLYIDDINARQTDFFVAQLSKVKAIKSVAQKVIDFLAQIENFQKKLWLKKKFVIRTDYCITLDKIPSSYYAEIAQNKAQVDEWRKLFDVNIQSENQLPLEPYLVLDTAFFDEQFKDRLLAEFNDLEETTDGLLINSENFQALNLFQYKFSSSIKSVYIDPPYNTDASPIMYKNSYRNSSWISLLNDRLQLSLQLLSDEGILCETIDDFQTNELVLLSKEIFGKDNYLGTVAIRNNPSGRPTQTGLAISHEYGHFFSKSSSSKLMKMPRSDEQSRRYKELDSNGKYMWELLRKRGTDSERKDSPKAYYPFYYSASNNSLRLPGMNWNQDAKEWEILEEPKTEEIVLYPIDENGIQRRWRWGLETSLSGKENLKVTESNGNYTVYYRYYEPDGVLAQTNWIESKYSATEHGTGLLKNYFQEYNPFSYPKSLYAVQDTLFICGVRSREIALDYFGGSGTTGHATIKLNKEDGGKRKYILVEMGTYFNTVTKPRIQKVIYSDNWKNGKPQDKGGISQMVKYQVLESYEDTLNNLQLIPTTDQAQLDFSNRANEEYLLQYMLEIESREQLFNLDMFRKPFNYQLKVTENNELKPTKVDLVETFNYLIGLYVSNVQRVKDIKVVEGTTRTGIKTLVIWRDMDTTTQDEVEKLIRRFYDSQRTREFQQIYINGDHHLENLRQDGDDFKIKLIEETFFKKMFNETEL